MSYNLHYFDFLYIYKNIKLYFKKYKIYFQVKYLIFVYMIFIQLIDKKFFLFLSNK